MLLTNPLFLLGLLAIALPIVVHLFNFRRYKKVYFSNVERLQQITTETKKQSKLREYLILASRILAILFLVLAFAQPYIPNKHHTMKKGGSYVSVYIDNSFSMENTNAEGTLLEMAKDKAREIAAAYKPSDKFQLLTNDMEGIQFRWLSRDDFLSAVEELKSSSASPTLSAMGSKQYHFLSSAPGENRFAFLISDFQTSTTDLDQFPTDSLIATTFVLLEASSVNNIAIDSISFSAPVFLKGNAVTATVWVSNHGDKAIDNLPIKLYVNDKERALTSVNLPSKTKQLAVDMPFVIDQTGILQCRVEATDYPIIFDDQFFFTINVAEQFSVLEIDGNSPNPYLQRLMAHDSLIRYQNSLERTIDFNHLTDHDLIILNELTSISSGLAQTLSGWVEAGGTLLIIPSPQADLDSYNQSLQLLHAPQFGPFVNRSTKGASVNLHSLLYSGVIEGSKDASDNLEMPSLTGYFPMKSGNTTAKESIILLDGGDDFLTVSQLGMGRTYLFATPLQTNYTDFVKQALFVPTCFNMAIFSRPMGTPYAIIDNVSPILLTNRNEISEGAMTLTNGKGDFELIPDIRSNGGHNYMLPHSQIMEAGNYWLSTQNEKQPIEGLSFNFCSKESQMEFLSRSELAKQLRDNNLKDCDLIKNAEKNLETIIRQNNEGTPLWRWCIVLSLLFILIEIFLLRSPRKHK